MQEEKTQGGHGSRQWEWCEGLKTGPLGAGRGRTAFLEGSKVRPLDFEPLTSYTKWGT